MFGLAVLEPFAKPIAFALAALALILVGRAWGQHAVYEDWMASNEQGRVQAIKIIQKQDVVTERVVTKYRDRVVYRDKVGETIEKEVLRYVESNPASAACMLDPEWLRLHNGAAGAIPAPAGGPDGPGRAAQGGP